MVGRGSSPNESLDRSSAGSTLFGCTPGACPRVGSENEIVGSRVLQHRLPKALPYWLALNVPRAAPCSRIFRR
jgi:hypothetical protein